jgi:RHS repeat-associated protein
MKRLLILLLSAVSTFVSVGCACVRTEETAPAELPYHTDLTFSELPASGVDASLCGWIAALGVETDPTGFMFMCHRYYSVQLAKFISDDPIGIAGGDFNFRRYCFNDPVGFFDPLGLHSMDCVGLQAMKDLVDVAGMVLTGFAVVELV